jgi:hypothetical protein
MAGNIIPAIATTNAMTAGLCVLQSMKVFQNNLMQAKMVKIEQGCFINTKANSPLKDLPGEIWCPCDQFGLIEPPQP